MSRSRVFLCSVDGMRPDALSPERTPAIDRLRREGAWSVATTVMPSVTLPCHTSMFRGVDVPRHGITTNRFVPLARPVPSFVDVAKEQGRRTGFFYNWEELRDLADPGRLDVSMMGFECECPEGDRRVADWAIDALAWADLDLLVVYLGWVDACGHKHGWMSPDYLEAVSNADRCIARILDALDARGLRDETTTVVLSDHGGHGQSHGTEMDEDMRIPWILHGRGVRSGHAIEAPVRIYDTCPTVTHLLGCQPHRHWEGRVVAEALVD